jgi:hypothetical protein
MSLFSLIESQSVFSDCDIVSFSDANGTKRDHRTVGYLFTPYQKTSKTCLPDYA